MSSIVKTSVVLGAAAVPCMVEARTGAVVGETNNQPRLHRDVRQSRHKYVSMATQQYTPQQRRANEEKKAIRKYIDGLDDVDTEKQQWTNELNQAVEPSQVHVLWIRMKIADAQSIDDFARIESVIAEFKPAGSVKTSFFDAFKSKKKEAQRKADVEKLMKTYSEADKIEMKLRINERDAKVAEAEWEKSQHGPGAGQNGRHPVVIASEEATKMLDLYKQEKQAPGFVAKRTRLVQENLKQAIEAEAQAIKAEAQAREQARENHKEPYLYYGVVTPASFQTGGSKTKATGGDVKQLRAKLAVLEKLTNIIEAEAPDNKFKAVDMEIEIKLQSKLNAAKEALEKARKQPFNAMQTNDHNGEPQESQAFEEAKMEWEMYMEARRVGPDRKKVELDEALEQAKKAFAQAQVAHKPVTGNSRRAYGVYHKDNYEFEENDDVIKMQEVVSQAQKKLAAFDRLTASGAFSTNEKDD